MPDDNREAMRIRIATYLAMGSCTQREAAIPSLACSAEDASSHLQAYIMCQIAPVLAARPLKHLLDMHGIKYSENFKLRHLCSHLYSFLDCLERGKCAGDELSLNGSARKARCRELKCLRADWPQVIPDNLKHRLIRDFKLEISAANLATFACGSCNEMCPISDKCSIGLEEFDLDVLSHPDHVSRADSNMEVDSEDEQQSRVDPWLNPQYPDPPMPMENTPYASLLIEPDSLESDPDTAEAVIAVCRRCHSDLK
ncbi:hypothetical protein B0H13DRAFT_2573600 [Mycena leptocephala]|nr:hypothetical protein B0H13DRAFT_2573600 [Mycena leptocephala]